MATSTESEEGREPKWLAGKESPFLRDGTANIKITK
jgi:hypothetical protein